MTPLEIEMALHYCTRSVDYGKDCGDNNYMAPAVQEALKRFVNAGLLYKHLGESRDYTPSDGLRFYVARLQEVPWPVQVWTMPGVDR